MKKGTAIGIGAIMVTAATVAVIATTQSKSGNTTSGNKGSLSGKVTDDDTGEPIQGVSVAIEGNTSTTDSNGNYGFTGIPAGTYTVTFSKTGYTTVTK